MINVATTNIPENGKPMKDFYSENLRLKAGHGQCKVAFFRFLRHLLNEILIDLIKT